MPLRANTPPSAAGDSSDSIDGLFSAGVGFAWHTSIARFHPGSADPLPLIPIFWRARAICLAFHLGKHGGASSLFRTLRLVPARGGGERDRLGRGLYHLGLAHQLAPRASPECFDGDL